MTKERYWIYDADGRLRGGIETKEPRASLARKLDRGGFTAVRVSGGAR